MSQESYKKLVSTFDLNEKELKVFLFNYYDAFAFNSYLHKYIKEMSLAIRSSDKLENLVDFFEVNNIDLETRKRIVISAPMIFVCENYNEQLRLIYKDSILEGIIIQEENDVSHAYRFKKQPRSITESQSMINDLIESENDHKKTYYIKYRNTNNLRKK